MILQDETFQPTARAMVLTQLEFSWAELDERLSTVTQEEFSWEPAPSALRVVPRDQERTPRTVGVGGWVQEWPAGSDETGTRTIAWVVAHLTEVFFERWEWTFGGHARRPATTLEYQGDVGRALELLRE